MDAVAIAAVCATRQNLITSMPKPTLPQPSPQAQQQQEKHQQSWQGSHPKNGAPSTPITPAPHVSDFMLSRPAGHPGEPSYGATPKDLLLLESSGRLLLHIGSHPLCEVLLQQPTAAASPDSFSCLLGKKRQGVQMFSQISLHCPCCWLKFPHSEDKCVVQRLITERASTIS